MQGSGVIRRTGAAFVVLQFGLVRWEWSTEDLIASWTLIGDDWQLLGNKTGAKRWFTDAGLTINALQQAEALTYFDAQRAH